MPNQTQASITAASTCWLIQMQGWCSSLCNHYNPFRMCQTGWQDWWLWRVTALVTARLPGKRKAPLHHPAWRSGSSWPGGLPENRA